MRSFANLLIYFGLICLILFGFLYWQRNTPKRLQFNLNKIDLAQTAKVANKEPKVLIIKDLGIEQNIYPASIKEGKWEATDKGISFLSSTPVPGEKGNSVIYGHNWKNILGSLMRAKPGQVVEIVYADGSSAKFKIEYTQVVTPDQTQILDQTKDSRITLYTCSGFLDTKRFVVTALLLK